MKQRDFHYLFVFCCFCFLYAFLLSFQCFSFKGTLSDLRQFLATESPLKMKKNDFLFKNLKISLKTYFVLKIFKYLDWLLRFVEKIQNWSYLWINSLMVYTVCFYCIPSWGLSKDIETKPQTSLPHIKLFKETKKDLVSNSAWLL